jgi:hypothetical protein
MIFTSLAVEGASSSLYCRRLPQALRLTWRHVENGPVGNSQEKNFSGGCQGQKSWPEN